MACFTLNRFLSGDRGAPPVMVAFAGGV